MSRTSSYPSTISRRRILGTAAGILASGGIAASVGRLAAADQPPQRVVTKGRIKQSVCAWPFKDMPIETLARNAAAMGLRSIELVPPTDWPVLKKYGLICALSSTHGFVDGLNRKENHEMCIAKIKEAIDDSAAAGFPNVITFSGMRKGMPDDVGLDNTVEGLKKVIGHAEAKKVNLCLEMLNSRVAVEMKGHPDYMCDRIEWAVEACRRVASPRMKILFDIYHVQIMQGDLITRIRENHEYVGHYHTAGVPGRNEIDDNQEVNYPAVLRVIAETGYQGYVGQEFIPTRDPMQSLADAVRRCDV
jgi:hydroxypyruvate isomerase